MESYTSVWVYQKTMVLLPSLARLCLRKNIPTGMQSVQGPERWPIGKVLYYWKKPFLVSSLLPSPPPRRVRVVARYSTNRCGKLVIDYTIEFLDNNDQPTNEPQQKVTDDLLYENDPTEDDDTEGEDESHLPPAAATRPPARTYPGWVPKKAPVEDERDPPKRARPDESASEDETKPRAAPNYRHTEEDYTVFRKQVREDETLRDARSRLSPIIGKIDKMRAEDLLSSGRQDQIALYHELFTELMEYFKEKINDIKDLILNNPVYVNAWRKYIKEELRPAFAAGQLLFPYGFRIVDEGVKVDGELERGELYDGVFQVESATANKQKHLVYIVKLLKTMYKERKQLE